MDNNIKMIYLTKLPLIYKSIFQCLSTIFKSNYLWKNSELVIIFNTYLISYSHIHTLNSNNKNI